MFRSDLYTHTIHPFPSSQSKEQKLKHDFTWMPSSDVRNKGMEFLLVDGKHASSIWRGKRDGMPRWFATDAGLEGFATSSDAKTFAEQQQIPLFKRWQENGIAWRYLLMVEAGAIPGGYAEDVPPPICIDILQRMSRLAESGWEPDWSEAKAYFARYDTMAGHGKMKAEVARKLQQDHDKRPSALLKSQVLAVWGSSAKPINGCDYVAGMQVKTGCLIVVVDGIFDKEVFRTAITEARAGGAASLHDVLKMHVFCDLATYLGHGIEVTKFEDMTGVYDRK